MLHKNGNSRPDESFDTLCALGLTSQQAKLYLTLAMLGQVSTAVLAKEAKMDRAETYRVLAQLQEMGFIEKIMEWPIRFRVISLKEGITSLLEKRKAELKQVEKKAVKLYQYIQPSENECSNLETETLLFVSKTSAVISRINKLVLNVQKNLDILTVTKRMSSKEKIFEATTIKALEKGVRVRFLIADPSGKAYNHKYMESLAKFPLYSVRISEYNATPLAIHDKKRALIFISDTVDVLDASVLITNNKRLVQTFQEYFDSLWSKSRPVDQ
jgi:sugar-specific transcriptional regulator TrmB